MRSFTEFVILHHFGCLFLPEKAEVILYPSGKYSLCSCEQEEVPYVHVHVCVPMFIPEGSGFCVKISAIIN